MVHKHATSKGSAFIHMHVEEGVCDLCQRSEEMLSALWHKMLKLTMFIKEKRQDSYWMNLTANGVCVCVCVCVQEYVHIQQQSRQSALWCFFFFLLLLLW